MFIHVADTICITEYNRTSVLCPYLSAGLWLLKFLANSYFWACVSWLISVILKKYKYNRTMAKANKAAINYCFPDPDLICIICTSLTLVCLRIRICVMSFTALFVEPFKEIIYLSEETIICYQSRTKSLQYPAVSTNV